MKQLYAGLLVAMVLLLSLGLGSCKVLQPLSEQDKVAKVLARHPELMKKDTVKVRVPFYVPQVVIQKQWYAVHDTIWQQRESAQLDSLINNLQASLDSAQRVATRAKLHQLLDDRPVLRDTLHFDTLGVSGRIWLKDRVYKLEIIRAAIRDTARGKTVVSRLAPCSPKPAAPQPLPWYHPEAWALPWYVWLLIGIILGICLLQGAVMLTYRFLTRRP